MKNSKRILFFIVTFLCMSSVAFAKEFSLDTSWKYANYSVIHSGKATLYESSASEKKDLIVAVNAGHGTSNVGTKKTYCHPDMTPKVTGGSTAAGATMAIAVSAGMEFQDGTSEASVNLKVATYLKDKLLEQGYDVLMIRTGSDVQLDNVARTVIANNVADIHIAIHFDSSTSDKGAFYMSVPNVSSYRNMSPVKETWEAHHELGNALISGLKSAGVKIYQSGSMEMDLTQTSYSTIPSIDIELGDKASDISDSALEKYATGLLNGVLEYDGAEKVTNPSNPNSGDNSNNNNNNSNNNNNNNNSNNNNNNGNSNPGPAPDINSSWGDNNPLIPASPDEGCETIFMNSDGSFNELGQFVQDLFTLIKFAAPILVIVFSTIDYAKAISAQNADEMKKAHIKFGKRLAAGVAIFLLPFLLDLLFELFGLYGLDNCGIR